MACPPETSGRSLEAIAANLIAVYEKVREVADGGIPVPEVVELFLTNFCNFACPHCRCSRYHGDRSQYLSSGSVAGLLDEFADKGIRTIELGGGGEPLDHPQVEQILSWFSLRSFRIGLITNGYQLVQRPNLIEPLLQCADWVRLSVDGISDDVYRMVHGRRDVSYSRLRETMVELVQRAQEGYQASRRPRIGMKLLVQNPNKHQLVNAVDEALAIGVDYLQFKWLEQHRRSVVREERAALAAELRTRLETVPEEALLVDMLSGYEATPVRERCVMSVLHPVIDWDGTVYLCAFFHHRKDRHAIGNVADGGFFSIWGSAAHRQRIDAVDSTECVANCPMLRYNAVAKFILREGFRFRYI